MKPQEFILSVGPAAKASMIETKIPASFAIAEAALESSWGSSQLSILGYNLFGVKADKAWHGEVLALPTREFVKGQWIKVDALWRKYPDWLTCIKDHAAFLLTNSRYKPAFETHNVIDFTRCIQSAGYATDPEYAGKILSIVRQHNLTMYDAV